MGGPVIKPDILPLPPQVHSQASPANILFMARVWSSKDDWGVNVIGVDILSQLTQALERGDSPLLLAEHASHVRSDCEREACATLLTFEQGTGSR